MKKRSSLGVVLPTLFNLVGAQFLKVVPPRFQFQLKACLIAVRAVVAMGLMIGRWPFQRYLSIRRTEYHAHGQHQIGI